MSIRSLSQLREDQAALLGEYRSRLEPELPVVGAEGLAPVMTIGKVIGFVFSDPTYGHHLWVQPQEFTGTPPVAVPAPKPVLRVYPTPNHSTFDYSLFEWIVIRTARGALLAERLS